MTAADFIEPCGLKLITGDASKTVNGVYTCDLLSHAALNLNKGDIWITVINNINAAAVAAFSNAACIVIPENIEVPRPLIEKSAARGITLFSYPGTAAELIISIGKILN